MSRNLPPFKLRIRYHADRYMLRGCFAVNTFTGATDSTWGTGTNWSTGSVPTAGDGNVATFDGSSPSCNLLTSSRVCNSLDCTNYTNTLGMGVQLTVSGNITLGASMVITGSGALLVNATSTMTANGVTWPNAFTFSGAATYTIADNWNIDGTLSVTANSVVNSNQISFGGNIAVSNNITLSGTATLIGDGTGTVVTTGTGAIKNNLTINSAGTVTLSGTVNYNTGTFTDTAGLSAGTSTLNCILSTTLAISAVTLNIFTFSGSGTTITLSENLNVAGLVGMGAAANNCVINGFAINGTGGFRHNGSTGAITGTTVFNVNGTQTLDGPSLTSGRVGNPITINAPGGTVTIDDTFNAQLDNLLYLAGTVVTDSGTWTGGRSNANILGGSVIA